MLEIADSIAATATGRRARPTPDLDVGLLFFGREELPFAESALASAVRPPPRDRGGGARDRARADGEPARARLPGQPERDRSRSPGEAAHSARPWLGRNAIHAAIAALAPVADLPIRDVEVDGLTYREVASVTTIQGGCRHQRRAGPRDRPRQLPVRARRTRRPKPKRRLRELLGHPSAVVEIVGNAPPGRSPIGNPLVERLRAAGDLAVGPKQAWTPVAEFGLAGVDAVNFGPGDPQYAHRDDEQVEVGALVRSYGVLHGVPRGESGNRGRERGRKGEMVHLSPGLRASEPYPFEELDRRKAAARRRGATGRRLRRGRPAGGDARVHPAGLEGRRRADLLVSARGRSPGAPRRHRLAGSSGASARPSIPTSTSCPPSGRRSRSSASPSRSWTPRAGSTW